MQWPPYRADGRAVATSPQSQVCVVRRRPLRRGLAGSLACSEIARPKPGRSCSANPISISIDLNDLSAARMAFRYRISVSGPVACSAMRRRSATWSACSQTSFEPVSSNSQSRSCPSSQIRFQARLPEALRDDGGCGWRLEVPYSRGPSAGFGESTIACPPMAGSTLNWWAGGGSNSRPSDYESPALTTELPARQHSGRRPARTRRRRPISRSRCGA